jgi:hypothetical protein
LALAKAGLARLGGDAEEARHQLGLATTLLGDAAKQPSVRAQIHNLHAYLADDVREARTHHVAAWQAATELGHEFMLGPVLVGFADLAVRLDQYELAAQLLSASVGIRGVAGLSQSDAARIEQDVRRHLGEARFAEVTQEDPQPSWSELIEVTLAS